MTPSEQYKKRKFTLSSFGIERGESRSTYFCTPRTSSIIGWTGVDGIHYCQVKTHGDTVFAVNPYADPKKHAFPVAEDFETLLRLLIACGHEAVLEQAHAWSREQYDRFVSENPATDEQKNAAKALAEQLSLTPMEDPYAYLKGIYDAFDFDTVPYKKDYYEWVPVEEMPKKREWKVYFSTIGEAGRKGERAGRELPVNKAVDFAGYRWIIPCAYVCKEGIVLDMLAEVPLEAIRTFHDKWSRVEDDGSFEMGITHFLTEEEEMTLAAENPLGIHFSPILVVDGRPLRSNHSSSGHYISDPHLQNLYNSRNADEILAHYGLSTDKCWMKRRFAFPWETASKPKLKTVGIRLRQEPVDLPGPHFHAHEEGQQLIFTHPITKIEHTLTVKTYETGEIHTPATAEFDLPRHYAEMTCTITPNIPTDSVRICDVRKNEPIKRSAVRSADNAAAVGIIGSADGPTAILFSRGKKDVARDTHTALSALTYEKQGDVEWRLVFREAFACEAVAELI